VFLVSPRFSARPRNGLALSLTPSLSPHTGPDLRSPQLGPASRNHQAPGRRVGLPAAGPAVGVG